MYSIRFLRLYLECQLAQHLCRLLSVSDNPINAWSLIEIATRKVNY